MRQPGRSSEPFIHSGGRSSARPGERCVCSTNGTCAPSSTASSRRRAVPNTDSIGPYIEALAETRIALRSPETVEAGRDDVPDFAAVYDRYRERLRRGNEADFDEQVYGAIEALLADPDLRRRWQDRCRHVLVDEFQDLTGAYLLLIRLLASPQLDVFGVGDDDQTIYGYAGADPGYLIDYDDLFPGADSHPLEVNYRCPAPVVRAATHLLSYNDRRIDKTITAGSGCRRRIQTRSASSGSRMRAIGLAAADQVESWLTDVDPSQIAVLARVNSALLPVHLALAERGVAILIAGRTGHPRPHGRLGDARLDAARS